MARFYDRPLSDNRAVFLAAKIAKCLQGPERGRIIECTHQDVAGLAASKMLSNGDQARFEVGSNLIAKYRHSIGMLERILYSIQRSQRSGAKNRSRGRLCQADDFIDLALPV